MVIKDMYDKIVTDMRTSGGISIHKFTSKINFKSTCLCTK